MEQEMSRNEKLFIYLELALAPNLDTLDVSNTWSYYSLKHSTLQLVEYV